MKSILITLASLFTTAAFAMPTIGDLAVYNVTYTSSTENLQYVMQESIVSKDAKTGLFNISNIYTIDGQTQTQNTQEDPSKMLTDAQVTSLIANCAASGGTLQSVTVPAGTFNTCAVPSNGNTFWVASGVAFGVVKVDGTTTDGGHMYYELQSFVNGK